MSLLEKVKKEAFSFLGKNISEVNASSGWVMFASWSDEPDRATAGFVSPAINTAGDGTIAWFDYDGFGRIFRVYCYGEEVSE